MTRRWFIRTSAATLVALTTIRLLPIGMLPRYGPVHDELYRRVSQALVRVYGSTARRYGRPEMIRIGSAAFAQLQWEYDSSIRFVSTAHIEKNHLLFKGIPCVETTSLGPWNGTIDVIDRGTVMQFEL